MNKVKMKVSNGSIYLFGQLDSEKDYEKIMTLVESTEGLTAVNIDNLTVVGSHHALKDLQITAKIKGILIRKNILDKNVSTWTIDIKTKDSHVYLSGQTISAKHKKIILDTIKSIPEVDQLSDSITVN